MHIVRQLGAHDGERGPGNISLSSVRRVSLERGSVLSPLVHHRAPSFVGNNLSFAFRYAVKRVRFAVTALGGRPAVTYAAYRTASTAVHHAIRNAGFGVSAKAHMLAPENLVARVRERQRFDDASCELPKSCHVGDWSVRLGILEPKREADFVMLVRDPWAVAHSIFVLNAAKFSRDFASPPESEDARAQLVDQAEARIFGSFPREIMSRWMRSDAAVALGWDPLQQPFDIERGASAYEHGPWRMQLMRTDIPDTRKSDILSAFFRRRSITVVRKNEALSLRNTSTTIADIAREAIARRPDEVARLLDDDFCRHFWSSTERANMRDRWQHPRSTMLRAR